MNDGVVAELGTFNPYSKVKVSTICNKKRVKTSRRGGNTRWGERH